MDDSTIAGWPCQPWALEGLSPGRLYAALLAAHGPQGWWPLSSRAGQGGYDAGGYHPGRFGVPDDPAGRLEIVAGAILTQNTSWLNVDRALRNLALARLLEPHRLAGAGEAGLADLVRPAGYFNQKAKKLVLAVRAGQERGWWRGGAPGREELLAIWGIGPETADCILLYAWHRPSFVVDAYTRRLLSRLDGGEGPGRLPFDPLHASYGRIRAWFMEGLEATTDQDAVVVNQEFHALIVRHAKLHCRARPDCRGCPFRPASGQAPG